MEMPEKCYTCPLLNEYDNCIAMDVLSTEVDVTKDKPDWCPLVPLPNRRKPLNEKGYRSGYIEGWNDAIDEIEKGE